MRKSIPILLPLLTAFACMQDEYTTPRQLWVLNEMRAQSTSMCHFPSDEPIEETNEILSALFGFENSSSTEYIEIRNENFSFISQGKEILKGVQRKQEHLLTLQSSNTTLDLTIVRETPDTLVLYIKGDAHLHNIEFVLCRVSEK